MSEAPKKEKKRPGPKPKPKIDPFASMVISEVRDVQTLRAPASFASLPALQKSINAYFEVYLPAVKIYPSPASLAKFLNFSSVKEMREYKGHKGGKSEISYSRLIQKALLRIEEILCHLVSAKQSFGGPIFLLKSQCGYSETEIIKLESSEGVKLSKDEREDIKGVARLLAERRRARLNGDSPPLQ